MAFNAYLVFYPDKNDIKGESSSELFKPEVGAIEIADYGFAAAMPVTASRSDGGGATVGRANFEAFTCNKNIDTCTPKLVEYCCLGKNISKICLHLFRAGDEGDTGAVKYAMVVFRHCVVTKVGKNVIFAGQAASAGHNTIGDGVIVTAQSGIGGDVAPGAKLK